MLDKFGCGVECEDEGCSTTMEWRDCRQCDCYLLLTSTAVFCYCHKKSINQNPKSQVSSCYRKEILTIDRLAVTQF